MNRIAEGAPIESTTSPAQGPLERALFQSAPQGIFVIAANGDLVSHNPQFCALWKISPNQLSDLNRAGALDSSDAPLLSQLLRKIENPTAYLTHLKAVQNLPNETSLYEIALSDGRTLEQHTCPLYGEQQQTLGRAWHFRDITRQKINETALLDLTRHDSLTGTANRRYFFERSQQEFARALRYQTPLSIASIDVDHLKLTNDRYGQEAGDEVLKSLCSYSQSLLRETELFARIGGEEFAILMPNTSLNGAMHLAERLRRVAANSKLSYNDQEIDMHISIGVTKLREGDESIDDCLRRADTALLRAKENGRNRVESAS